MGSRVLSRSFQLEKAEGEDSENKGHDSQERDTGGDESMDVDTSMDNGQAGSIANNANEDVLEAGADGEDDEDSDDEDEDETLVAMVPMADMLNACYGSVNVRGYLQSRSSLLKAAIW